VTAASGRSIEAIPYSQLSVGSHVFSDRTYYFVNIGDYSPHTFYIRGPNDDKDTPGASAQWTIKVNVPVNVYLDFWCGQETKGFAQWNDGWTMSSMAPCRNSDMCGPGCQCQTGVVYEKYFASGAIVLYGNDGHEVGTYVAFVTPAGVC